MSYYQCNCRNDLSGLSEKEREDFQCGCGLNLSSSDLCNDSEKELCPGPPMLDRQNNGIEGLAFLGLSLSRYNEGRFSCKASVSRQTEFDFDLLQDRNYKYFCSTNDDGWLVGGGENGDSYKLENADSAHIEICRVGSFNEDWGGVSLSYLERIMTDGTIKIPLMAVLPTGIIETSHVPPEVEVRFDFKNIKANRDDEIRKILSRDSSNMDETRSESAHFENLANWQLRFVHNQLFHCLQNSNRFCPGAHHMTFVRKATWKHDNAKTEYFKNCSVLQEEWEKNGPKLLQPVIPDAFDGNGIVSGAILSPVGEELVHPHGIYLFKDRKTIIKYFKPNFLPPYNTDEKVEIIRNVLKEKWDEKNLLWVAENYSNLN